MRIAENILKHSLQHVYFLTGTALAGKTTMAEALAQKHGLIHYNDNWHEDRFNVYRSICDERYQPKSTKKKETTDWEAYFGRSVEEFLADRDSYGEYDEYTEFMMIDLVKLSQDAWVVADVSMPVKLVTEISDYDRIACMLASPELVTCANYGKRGDHREFLACIMSLKEPEKKIAVQDELFQIEVERTYEEVRKHGLFSIVRTEESTVQSTLEALEKHFGLESHRATR